MKTRRFVLKFRKGVAAVEFALILPLLVLLLFGIIEFGLLLYNQAVITNASREAARYAATYYINPANAASERPTCDQVKTYVATYVNARLINFPPDPFSAEDVKCPDVTPYKNNFGYAGYVNTIGIEYQYNFLVFDGLLSLLNRVMPTTFPEFLKLKAQASMRDENQH